MEVNDISRRTHRYIDHTSRVTDVLDPTYSVNGLVIADDAKYTKPKKNPGELKDSHLLKTEDIEGARPGWIPPMRFNPPIEARREFRNTNFIGDIDGAQADTIKHSIVTRRVTNPINPVYQALDPGQVLRGPVEPLIPITFYSGPGGRITRQSTAASASSYSNEPETRTPVPRSNSSQQDHNNRNELKNFEGSSEREHHDGYTPSYDRPRREEGSSSNHVSHTRSESKDVPSRAEHSYKDEPRESSASKEEGSVSSSPKPGRSAGYAAVSYAAKFVEQDELIGSAAVYSAEKASPSNEAADKPRANLDVKPKPHSSKYAGKNTEVSNAKDGV